GEAVGDRAVEDARVEQAIAVHRLHREMRIEVDAALARLVEDLPVDQPPRAGKPDRAGADAAQGKRDRARALAAISEGIAHVRGGRARSLVHRLLPCSLVATGAHRMAAWTWLRRTGVPIADGCNRRRSSATGRIVRWTIATAEG